MTRPLTPLRFGIFLLVYLVLAVLLFEGQDDSNLHTLVDTSVCLITCILAWLLWDLGVREESASTRWLATAFAVTAFWEALHALVAVALIASAIPLGYPSRPATWPVPAYLLPLGIGSALGLSQRARASLKVFAGGLLVLGIGLLWSFRGVPPYAAPAWMGITRPFLLGVPVLWVAVGLEAWRRRQGMALATPLALTTTILVLAHFSMLYSTAPHDPMAMIAHAGKMVGLLFLMAQVIHLRGAGLRERDTAARYAAAAVAFTDDAVITKTLDGIITSWNPGAERVFGYAAQEVLGRSVMMVIPPEHAAEEQEILGRLRRGERVEQAETVRLRKDGRRLQVSVTVSPIKDAAGRLVGASKILRDVTERKETAVALQELGVRLDTTLDNMDAAFFTVDHDWRFTYVNKEFERTLKRSREDLLGKGLWDEFKDAIGGPSDLYYHQAMSENRAVAFEEFYPPIGMWLEVRAYPSDAGLAVYFRDVTERKRAAAELLESQARLSGIVTSAMDAIITIDSTQRILLFNLAAERMFRCPASEMLGRPIEELIPARFRAAHGSHVDRFGAAGVTSRGMGALGALSALRRDGEEFPIEASISQVEVGGQKLYTVILRDITERKRAAAELLASQARLSGIVTSAMDAIITIDSAQHIILFNRAAERMFRCAASAMLGKPLDELIPARFRGVHAGHVERFGTAGATSRSMGALGALSGLRSDGEEFPIEASISQVEVEGQKLYTVILRDITERRRAAAELLESQARLSGIVTSAMDAIITIDSAQRIVLFNRAAERMFRCTASEMQGRSLDELIPQRFRAAHAGHVERFGVAGVTSRGMGALGALSGVRRNGEEFPIEASISQVEVEGQKLYTVILRDITERKRTEQALRQSEEGLRQLNAELEQRVIHRTSELEAVNTELRHSRAELNSLFESLPGLYLVLTPDLEIVAASDAYLEATLTTRDAIVGRGLFEVFPDNPDEVAATGVSNLRASLDRVRQHAKPDTMAIQKYDVRRPDGVFEERYWSPINSPVIGADHEIKYIVHRVEEVTDFVRRQASESSPLSTLSPREQQMAAEIFQSSQSLQATNQQLEEVNKELEAFSYSVSHDLRAPLRTVDGFSQALLEDFGPQLPEEGQRQVRTIREGAQRMGALIDDLLAFSRLGRQALDQSPAVDMDELVRGVLEELEPDRASRTVEIRAAPLPPCHGDGALLRQVWVNLLSNAHKYSRKQDHAVVEVGSLSQNGQVEYFVRDNGTGFDMRYAHKLFGVFQRLHRVEDYEGTGVGLAIVQRIVQRHGGRVWAESAPGRGATFRFTLKGGAPHE